MPQFFRAAAILALLVSWIPAWTQEKTADPTRLQVEIDFLAARRNNIRAGLQGGFHDFLKGETTSPDRGRRVWALTRLVEAGDYAYFGALAEELGRQVQELMARETGEGPMPSPPAGGFSRSQNIHPHSPFYASIAKTIRLSPTREVTRDLYVLWCYNTLPSQRDLIFEIAPHVEVQFAQNRRKADPWSDPRFWIVTDWALAWGEAEDFDAIEQLINSEAAKAEFRRIAKAVITIPGFFACRIPTPEGERSPIKPPSEVLDEAQAKAAAALSDEKDPFRPARVKSRPPVPPYPREALARSLMANLEVQIVVDPKGTVCMARTRPGPFLAFFAPMALQYVSRWGFEPSALNGEPVFGRFHLSMPFRLR